MSRFLPLNSHCLDISLSSAWSLEFCSSERVIGWIFTTNGLLSSVGSSLINSRQFNRTWFERRKNCFLSITESPLYHNFSHSFSVLVAVFRLNLDRLSLGRNQQNDLYQISYTQCLIRQNGF